MQITFPRETVAAFCRRHGIRRLSVFGSALAFEFVKEKVLLEILPLDGVVETLQRGTGSCFQLISLFIALCRAAGIPARYKMFAMNLIDAWPGCNG